MDNLYIVTNVTARKFLSHNLEWVSSELDAGIFSDGDIARIKVIANKLRHIPVYKRRLLCSNPVEFDKLERFWEEDELIRLIKSDAGTDEEYAPEVSIKKNDLDLILYFANDWLRLMGHGGEYTKLSGMVKSLHSSGVPIDEKYYYIWDVIGRK